MKTLMAGLVAALLGLSGPAAAQTCPTCIHNQAAPENAQINIGTATVRGTLTVSTVAANSVSAASITATSLAGGGSGITGLNASQLLSGVVAAARLVGSYTGITSVGTLVSGVWNATPVGTQYGGTGQNWVTQTVGRIPYFSTTGTLATLAPGTAGQLLQTNGAAAPSYTGAPAVLGTNVTAIPLANLQTGPLPAAITVSDASLVSISASKVSGNIAGSAASLSVPLPIGNLAAGQLPTSNPASSITATGVSPGTYGGPLQMAQLHVNSDGRVDVASQFLLMVPPANISTGTIPSGITIAASQISTGTIPNYVIASSIGANGVLAGSYGDATRTVTLAINPDGRTGTASQQLIAINTNQILAGALPGNITVPAASITTGTLSTSVTATKVANSGVSAGTYGGLTQIPQIVVAADGRVTSATQFTFPALSTSTVASNIDNNWTHSQTFIGVASVTLQSGNLSANQITAALLFGNGAGITNISPFVISSGTLPVDVVASSVGVNTISDPQVAVGANIAQSKIAGLSTSFAAKASSGTNNDITDLDALVTATATGQIEAGGFFTPGPSTAAFFYGDGSNLTNLPSPPAGACAAGAGADSVLCQGSGNTAAGANSVVSGGISNDAAVQRATIGGGQLNVVSGVVGTIGGGVNNTITAGSVGTIGGGQNNTMSGAGTTIAGGLANTASNTQSSVGGGNMNNASGNYSTVSGGFNGAASGANSAIGGGNDNIASGNGSVVAGGGFGNGNEATGNNSFVGSGARNHAKGLHAVVVGGGSHTGVADENNNVDTAGRTSFIGAGFANYISATESSIVAGSSNSIAGGAWNAIGGGRENKLNAAGSYNTIAGGQRGAVTAGENQFIGGGDTNAITTSGNYNTIGGGINNTISGIQAGITIAGGSGNTSSGNISTVGGGTNNNNSGHSGTIGGGNGNVNTAQYATVSGGRSNSNDNEYGVIAGGRSNVNTLGAFGAGSVIGGGESNTISNYLNTQGVVIAGGSSNGSGGMGAWSVISGGNQNKAQGAYSVTPGGLLNSAFGDYSYAAGRRAKATAQGSFVMADSQDSDLIGATTDQLLLRFQGGVEIQTSSFSVTGDAYFSIDLSTQATAGAGALTTVSCSAGKYALHGGCACTGGTALNDVVNAPYPTPAAGGTMPTGWQCQATGSVGADCGAYVTCSRITKP